MSRFIEGLDYYLPPRGISYKDIYQQVLIDNNTPGLNWAGLRSLDVETSTKIGMDMVKAGIAFLSNRSSSPVLKDIGFGAWQALLISDVPVCVSHDLKMIAFYCDFPPQAIANLDDDIPAPQVLVDIHDTNPNLETVKISKARMMIFFPISYLECALKDPLYGLAQMAIFSSMFRDLTFIHRIDGEAIRRRANACQAHVYIEALQENPSIVLYQEARNSLDRYPDGVMSLPEGMWYRSPSIPFR